MDRKTQDYLSSSYSGTVKEGKYFWLAVAALLASMGTIQTVTALGETQTWDEAIHIAAGYAYLKYGDYAWNHEHPPLVKLMSALPLVALHPRLSAADAVWRQRDETQLGIDFLYKNRVPADTLLFRARSMTILLTLLGGLALAVWTRRRFGALAAVAALALYCFDPNLIAHGRYVTTDVPMAVFFFLVCAAWCEALLSGRRRDLALAALTLALALTVKFSAILLVPVVAALYCIRWIQAPKEFGWRRLGITIGVVIGACAIVIPAVYWRETVRCLTADVPPLAAAVNRNTAAGEALFQIGSRLGLRAHAFLTGLDAVATHNQGGHQTYLMGQRSETGWWYYFPVVFSVKSTMAAILGTALVVAAGLWGLRRPRSIPFPWIVVVLPPLFYFVVSTTSGINLGVRHILPVYPLLYVAVGALIAALRPRLGYAALALVVLQAAECGSIYPDYLAFFNAASGGPGNGPRYLVDSNIDWGQDVKKLIHWLDAHGTRRVWINYFGKAELKYYGVDQANLPAGDDAKGWEEIDGFAAASVTPLMGVYVPWGELEPLRRRTPVAKVGYSIYVYDLRHSRR